MYSFYHRKTKKTITKKCHAVMLCNKKCAISALIDMPCRSYRTKRISTRGVLSVYSAFFECEINVKGLWSYPIIAIFTVQNTEKGYFFRTSLIWTKSMKKIHNHAITTLERKPSANQTGRRLRNALFYFKSCSWYKLICQIHRGTLGYRVHALLSGC